MLPRRPIRSLLRLPLLLILLGAAQACAEWPPAPRLPMPDQDQFAILPPSVEVKRNDYLWDVTFKFLREGPAPARVTLAGSFNGWNPESMPMDGPDAAGEFRRTITVGPGEYRYKFVVDGDWQPDPRNPHTIPEDYNNSVVTIGAVASVNESTAKPGDGQVEAAALLHMPNPGSKYFQPRAGNEAVIRVRTFAHDVDAVACVLQNGPSVAMQPVLQDKLFAYWEAGVKLPENTKARDPGLRTVTYTFVFSDGDRRFSHPQDFTSTFKETAVFETPEWARHAVWYQIMPDRFRNGVADNDPDPVRPWTSEWFTPSPFEGQDGQTFYKWYVFSRLYGGDFQGLTGKLDYLRDLGVTAIYLNPVFQSPSHHKYDATSYVHVDEHLGVKGDFAPADAAEDALDPKTWTWTESDKVFLHFLKEAKARGFKVIIDGVFNHVGEKHTAFLDVQKNKQQSRFADWFDVTSWEPFDHNGWAGHKSLPVFRKDAEHGIASPSARKHIFDVTRRWMDPDGDGDPSDGIDGWRLDVPNEVPLVFWVEWRAVVKSINPQAYISGEIWDRAEQWLDGRTFDAVMNYQFSKPAIQWIFDREHKITPHELDRRLAELRLAYPPAATYVMQNLVDSHDTDRVASMALNPDRHYDAGNRIQDNGPNYSNARPGPVEYARVRLLALLQMTYVGAPMIYYGDEVGMWGADDPTNRKPMLWEDLQPYEKADENFVMKDQLEWYRRVIMLRNAHTALRVGSFQSVLADDAKDVWVFLRSDDQQQVLVALNASDRAHELELTMPPDALKNWALTFSGGGAEIQYAEPGATIAASDGKLKLTVPAIGGTVLTATR